MISNIIFGIRLFVGVSIPLFAGISFFAGAVSFEEATVFLLTIISINLSLFYAGKD